MRSSFSGIPQAGLDFLRALARHNSRDWFQPRKAVFEEQLKRPMHQIVEALNGSLARFAPEHVTDPEKAVYRFYRDTRFSPDKTPYKDHVAATFPRRGMARHEAAVYYFQVSHKGVGVGGGAYMPTPETLTAMRRHVAEHPERLRAIAAVRPFRRYFGEVQGARLARVPKGFACDHPAADLLRFKQYFVYAELPPGIATTPELLREIVAHFRAMAPFVDFLNAPLVARRKKTSANERYF